MRKDKIKHKKSDEEVAITLLYGRYKASAANAGREFDLRKNEFAAIVKSICHYCGRPPSQSVRKQKSKQFHELKYNGIDRKHNNFGYSPANAIPCCIVCNRAKMAMSYRDFLIYLDQLIQFRTKYDYTG